MVTDATQYRPAKRRAASALARLTRAELDNDSFRYEAAAILRPAIGFDWWCWPLADPGARLPSRYVGEVTPLDQDQRRLARLLPDPWTDVAEGASAAQLPAVIPLSAATEGDLSRDPLWREMLGPAGTGDVLGVTLTTDGTCWGQLHLGRDSSDRWFGEEDISFAAEVAPLIAARLRDGLRACRPDDNPDPDPGTIIVDRDLSLVAATDQAWRWIDRLGMHRPNESEPLPGFVYAAAARAAASADRPPRPARVRLQDARGRWVVVRVAPLTQWSAPLVQDPQNEAAYVITLEPARSEDLAPLLMRAWALTPREREVARLVIDGLSTEDISTALFISAHTVRDHLKTIFGKVGVSRRSDLVAALAGQAPRCR